MTCGIAIAITAIITAVVVSCWIAWATFFSSPKYTDDDLFEELWRKETDE